MISPAQLRDLMSSKALDCSQGWLADQLGWQGENATLRVSRLMRDDAEISLTTSKHLIRIAREQGYELHNGNWIKTDER